MFVPTHLNRNKQVFSQAIDYIRGGGYADFTAGEKTRKGYSIADALSLAMDRGSDFDKITVSSDANGSIPAEDGKGTGVGKVTALLDDLRECVLNKNMKLDIILKAFTSNVAKVLKLYPVKGCLKPASDADILVFDRDGLKVDKVISRGELLVDRGEAIRKGKYEK
jgi:beta-aspartyl-dipeptidase (metallo-type)